MKIDKEIVSKLRKMKIAYFLDCQAENGTALTQPLVIN